MRASECPAILSDHSIAGQRTSALVTAILGCLTLLLASIGVYESWLTR